MSSPSSTKHYGSLNDDVPSTSYGESSVGSSKASVTSEDDDTDLRCGYGRWRPDCLQKLNNSKVLLACICWLVFIQSFVVNGIVNVDVASLERRFDLSGTQVAWIVGSYELSAGVLSFIIGYLGTFVHKPRLLSVTAGIMAVGSFIMVLPHIIVEPYTLGVSVLDICHHNGTNTSHCNLEQSGLSNYVFAFIVGQVIHAVGAVAVYTVGTPMVDESADSKNSPLYIGIMHGISVLGVAGGFLFGGAMLHYYVDIDRVDMSTIDVTQDDPRWVGAWWIGFAVASCAALTASLFMSCFARELPETASLRAARVSEAYKGLGEKETQAEDFGRSWKDFLTSFKIVFCNPTWVLMTLGATLEAGLVQSIVTFLPQALQFQFALTPAKAALLAGAAVVPAAALGQVLGGLIPKWLNLRARGMILQSIISISITLVFSLCLLLHCENQKIAGVTVQYLNSSTDPTGLDHSCNEGCGCHAMSYEPVCGYDDVQYFSACHAGCTVTHPTPGQPMVYSNCSCLPPDVHSTASPGEWNASQVLPQVAIEGSCEQDCDAIKLFLPLLVIICIGTFIANTAFVSLTMRIVPVKQRSFANGLQGTVVRFLGATPFPILFGMLVDKACLVWSESCYEESGSCWVYDSHTFSWMILCMALVVKAVSVTFLTAALLVYKPPEDPIKDETTENMELDERELEDPANTTGVDDREHLVITDTHNGGLNNNYKTIDNEHIYSEPDG